MFQQALGMIWMHSQFADHWSSGKGEAWVLVLGNPATSLVNRDDAMVVSFCKGHDMNVGIVPGIWLVLSIPSPSHSSNQLLRVSCDLIQFCDPHRISHGPQDKGSITKEK